MKKYINCTIFLIMFSSSLSLSAESTQHKLPKLTVTQAQGIAIKAVAGEVQLQKLEYEFGRAVYAFVIKTSKNESMEVEVDGNTGKVIEIEKDDGKE